MPIEIIVGTQWGDEGKGRIVDLLASRADLVARYNGGDNAGHTVTVSGRTFKLHLVPSGIIHPHTVGLLGSGMVVNPETLLQEIEMLRTAGVEVNPARLKLSYAAQLITPAHRALDRAQEQALGKGQIGTTGRGIGPAYTDKASRRGLRAQELVDAATIGPRIVAHVQQVNLMLENLYHTTPLDPGPIAAQYQEYARQLAPYVANVSSLASAALEEGKTLLAEGAQGTLLDLDQGTYPYVTSSNTTAPGMFTGLGLGICPVKRVVGVTKAFQTRVGEGPFPTEVFNETATQLRGTGKNPWDEFGTTTGRPRRVGWLDSVLLRYAVRINGLTELVLTKLDVLTGMPSLRICRAYRADGQLYETLPFGPGELASFEPVYEELPGWTDDLRDARSWDDLPEPAHGYIRRIEELSGIPVRLISVGPERSQIIERS